MKSPPTGYTGGMNVQVNGKTTEVPEKASVAALVEQLQLGAKRIAVEVNAELVVKKDWPAKTLNDGDRVEIVSFVGGG